MQEVVFPHWDLLSVIFYVMLGFIGSLAIKYGNGKQTAIITKKGNGKYCVDVAFLVWWVSWTFVAAFRLINDRGVGGTDSYAYKNYFYICNGATSIKDYALILEYSEHYEILWKLINRVLRFFTNDYHVLFVLAYGFITWSFQKVVKNFSYDIKYTAPFICLFFVFLRGFNTLRTEIAVAFILLMVLELKRENYKSAIIFGMLSIGFQISSALYCLFIPFHYLYRKGKLKIYKVVIMIVLSIVIGRLAQTMMTGELGRLLGHSYASYASRNIGHSFLENFWKISFGQILIGFLIVLFDRRLKHRVSNTSDVALSIQFVREVCLFDVITIPITFILNVWRGYEYLYIFRLMMWSYVTYVFLKGKSRSTKYFIVFIEIAVFTAWLIFRINHTWESSGYLPYVLSVFE